MQAEAVDPDRDRLAVRSAELQLEVVRLEAARAVRLVGAGSAAGRTRASVTAVRTRVRSGEIGNSRLVARAAPRSGGARPPPGSRASPGGGRRAALQLRVHAVEHVVRVARRARAAPASGSSASGLRRRSTQPLHRAVRRTPRSRPPTAGTPRRAGARSSSLSSPSGGGRRHARARSRGSALPLLPRRRLVEAPRRRPRGRATACGRSGRSSSLGDVLEEERRLLRAALLVARARRQDEQALRARRADVEEVALAVELVLAHRQREPGRARDLAAVVVGEERVAAAPAAGTRPPAARGGRAPAKRRARTSSGPVTWTRSGWGGSPSTTVMSCSASCSSTTGGRGGAERAHLRERVAGRRERARHVRLVAAEDVRRGAGRGARRATPRGARAPPAASPGRRRHRAARRSPSAAASSLLAPPTARARRVGVPDAASGEPRPPAGRRGRARRGGRASAGSVRRSSVVPSSSGSAQRSSASRPRPSGVCPSGTRRSSENGMP